MSHYFIDLTRMPEPTTGTWITSDNTTFDLRKPYQLNGEQALYIPEGRESAFLEMLFGSRRDKSYSKANGVAVIAIDGPLEQRGGWFEGYDTIRQRFEAALADKEVRAVVLRINSPGGAVAGLFDTVAAMRAAKSKSRKKVYAFADEQATSAAYALATVADSIHLPASGTVGSIGVITALVDATKLNEKLGLKVKVIKSGAKKALGSPDEPMTDEAVADRQARVDALAEQFAALVSQARPMSSADVLKQEAAVFYGADALKANLADSITSFDALLEKARKDMKMDTEANAVLAEVKAQLDASNKALSSVLAAAGKATAEEAVGAIHGLREKADRHDAIAAQLEETRGNARKAEIERRIEKAKDEGKLTPKSEKFARKLCAESSDPIGSLDAYLESLPLAVPAKDEKVAEDGSITLSRKWEDMSNAEKHDLKFENPDAYAVLHADYKRRNKIA